MRKIPWFSILVWIVLSVIPPAPGYGQDARVLIVSLDGDGDYTTITAALDAAQDGDTIEVHAGTYTTPLDITKSVTLIGIDYPVIDGGDEGSLVHITAPDVRFQGFKLINTGNTLYTEDAGIIVKSPGVTLADNILDNVLFGIYFANASNGVAENNIIHGQDRDLGMRGDGIRVWYSNNIHIRNNTVTHTRDTLIWYADEVVIEGNTFYENRYGIHFMYSHYVTVAHNEFDHNSVGAFLMYSKEITFDENTFSYNYGASGYGLALKDTDLVTATNNVFVGNKEGLYLDNSPSLYEGVNTFTGNIFAYNDTGTATQPSVERNIFQENVYLHNRQQVGIRGRVVTSHNTWSQDGKGNYWSDYAGYDKDGNGFGELPYKSDKLFENLVDKYPVLQLFAYSPIAQAIEFTGTAFPAFRPAPIVVDDTPMMSYSLPPHLAKARISLSPSFAIVPLALIAVTIGLYALAFWQPVRAKQMPGTFTFINEKAEDNMDIMVSVENLSKQYGEFTALNQVSFSIKAGESVALWGGNGAGKTTTLRCLLGVIPFAGKITVRGIDVHKDGKAVRTVIGYVPQEAVFYDLTVRETLRFYARLKKVSFSKLSGILKQVGLVEQEDKAVRMLSGGMKQRLALAVGLLSDPPVLLLDEATANLDSQARQEFLHLIYTLNQAGKTVIFSTHRMEEVVALAQRVLVLKNGQLVQDTHPDTLNEQHGLKQWLRIQIAGTYNNEAIHLLAQKGFSSVMNTSAFYVHIGASSKMTPLRLLEEADIPIQDFDVVSGDINRPEVQSHD